MIHLRSAGDTGSKAERGTKALRLLCSFLIHRKSEAFPMYDVIIIGCGVVGAATAYRLARCRLRVAVLEAQNDVEIGRAHV